ncbi:hypothetical protein CBR_g38139 [Chara braunii]|uniref:MINDY deubiquitinase domain-containing protein n=1 Tax=Chara braunii TaxID=69332 RepID=A0A388LPK9_CHABU|nr:hypothetical protein CBR_g38139 [Chara braunii]|eukprot:GBG84165.1 hypothetical protein CBR_g38139 [Chara braunii]
MLLRNTISIRGEPSEILLEDLMHLVADRLLDSNVETADDEYGRNKRQNIEDAIQLLPRLATGIDVNVRFRNIHDFEFTRECAIFDLLDISIVHGWIIDPQDEPTCRIIGSHSYNTLVEKLVALKGLLPSVDDSDLSGTHHLQEAEARGVEGAGGPSSPSRGPRSSPSGRAGGGRQTGVDETHQMEEDEDAALKRGLELSLSVPGSRSPREPNHDAEGNEGLAERCMTSSTMDGNAHDRSAEKGNVVVASDLDRGHGSDVGGREMAGDVEGGKTSDAERGQGVDLRRTEVGVESERNGESGGSPGKGHDMTERRNGKDREEQGEEQTRDPEGTLPVGRDDACRDPEESNNCHKERRAETTSSSGDNHEGEVAVSGKQREEEGEREGGAREEVDGSCPEMLLKNQEDQGECVPVEPGNEGEADREAGIGKDDDCAEHSLRAVLAVAEKTLGREVTEEELNDMIKEGFVIENFLSNTASQLTYCGLFMLQEGVKERQLCVFFRNNHFNTMFKYNGQLYILATDQGYLNQANLVWEKLSEVDGDTQFATGTFDVFKTDANWAAAGYYVPRDSDQSYNKGGERGNQGQHDYDADLQLAWELHRHEERLMAARRDASQGGANDPHTSRPHLSYQQGGAYGAVRPQRAGQEAAQGSSGSSSSGPSAQQTPGNGSSTSLPSSTSMSSFISKFSPNLSSKRPAPPRRGDTPPQGSSSTAPARTGERKRECVIM